MCMKTKGSMTQCPIIHRPFWPKNAKVRDNRSEIRVFLNGNARIAGREAEKVDACKHGAELSRRPATFSRLSRSMRPATPYAPSAGPALRVLSPWGRGPEISGGGEALTPGARGPLPRTSSNLSSHGGSATPGRGLRTSRDTGQERRVGLQLCGSNPDFSARCDGFGVAESGRLPSP